MAEMPARLDHRAPPPALVPRDRGAGPREYGPSLVDRRASARATPLDHRAWLGAWDGDDFVARGVRLLDIGSGGALVESEAAHRRDQVVWFCLYRDMILSGCLRGRVVAVTDGGRGRRVRIAFERPCPEATLAAAIDGTD